MPLPIETYIEVGTRFLIAVKAIAGVTGLSAYLLRVMAQPRREMALAEMPREVRWMRAERTLIEMGLGGG